MAIKPIEILINAKDNASGVFNSLKGTVATVGAAIATYFGINAFANIVKGAADLEQGMSRVQAATGATAEEMAVLRKAAEDAGANTKYTATEAAAALENLAKAGLSSSEAVAALPAVLNLAAAGDIELATSAEFVTKAVMGMGLAFEDAGRVADVLALGANATNTSVTGLAQALSYAAPVAQSLGLSLESTVAIIGKFADAGIDASRAGTALNSILSQFSNPASKFREELAAAGITTNNFETALGQLAAAGPRGSKAIIAVGQEAGPALRALLNQGIGALSDLTARLRESEGSAAATAKVMQDNLKGAFSGLSSAWDTVKNTLGTPVLPVLTQGVNELATAFRSAVADGTVGRFGESIATAFKNGLQFVREFIAGIDFSAVLAGMQRFADDVNVTLTRVGEYAANAGNVFKTAWGVMSAGSNTVLAVIYKVGEAFAGVASNIQSGVALIMDGLAKITFGGVSRSFAEAAAEIRLSAEATWAASEALAAKSSQAFADATAGARMAREGFAGLTGAMRDAEPAAKATAVALGDVAKQLEATAEKNAKARAATEAKAAADAQAAAAIQQLKDDYRSFLDAGDLQRATEAFVKLEAAQRASANAGKDAAKSSDESAKRIAEAYQALGITSTETLKRLADQARTNYDIVRTSGVASAQDVGNAFKVAADKAIAANNGIAPSWVQVEAAARGYRLSVDDAGKSTLELATKTSSATGAMTSGINGVAGAWGGVAKELQNVDAWTARVQARNAEVSKNSLGGTTFDKQGFETNTAGQRVEALVQTVETMAALIKERGGTDQQAVELAPGLLAAWNSLNATTGGMDLGINRDWDQVLARALESSAIGRGTQPGGPSPSPAPSPVAQRPYVVNLNFENAYMGPVPTDQSGVASLERLMQALADGKSRT